MSEDKGGNKKVKRSKIKKIFTYSMVSMMASGSILTAPMYASVIHAEENADNKDTNTDTEFSGTETASSVTDGTTFNITTNESPNGTIEGAVNDAPGSGTYTVKATANEGYMISDMKVNGKTVDNFVGGMTSYTMTFQGLDEDKKVEVSFSRIVSSGKHKVNYSVTNANLGTVKMARTNNEGTNEEIALDESGKGQTDVFNDGDTCVLNIQANDGNVIDKVFINNKYYSDFDGKNAGKINFVVRADSEIEVKFKQNVPDTPKKYKVETISGEGGNVYGGGEYDNGTDCTVTAAANSGYYIDSFKVDGNEQLTGENEQLTSMKATLYSLNSDHKVEVHFRPVTVHEGQYTVTTSAGAGGTIDPTQSYDNNKDVTINFKANDGYVISGVSVDGTAVDIQKYKNATEGSYTFQSIGNDHKIDVTFAPSQTPEQPVKSAYNITTSAGEGGNVSASVNDAPAGGDYTVTYSANDGYAIQGLIIDGQMKSVTEGASSGSYTFKNLSADHTVNVLFVKKAFNILTTAADGGTITPSITGVDGTGPYKIEIKANPGYVISNINVDGESQATDYDQTEFTLNYPSIGKDHRVDVTFVKTAEDAKTVTINTEQSPNGKITGGLGTVDASGTYYLKATGDKGYVIDKIYDNGKVIKEATGEKTYTVTIQRPNENHIIQAAFRKSSPKSEDTDDASTVNHRIEVKYGVEGNHVNPLNAGTVTLASSDEATGFVGEAMDEKGIVSKAYPDVREGTNNILNISAKKGYYIKSYKLDGEEFALENNEGVEGNENVTNGSATDPGKEGTTERTGTTAEVKTYVTRKDVKLENGAITKDHTLEVTFAKVDSNTAKGVIDAYVGNLGALEGTIDEVTLNADGTRTVKYTPAKGYVVESVKVDGKAVKDTDGTYVFKASDNNGHDFRVAFRKRKPTDGKTDISKWKVSGIKDKVYNGKKQTQKVKVTSGKKTATVKLAYAKNVTSIGKTYVTITGTGKYYGTIKKYFNIKPAKPSVSAKLSKNKMTVKVTGLKGGAKGEISYRKSGAKKWKTYKASSKTVNISKGKYYVRARAYKGSLKSDYSSTKTVKKN